MFAGKVLKRSLGAALLLVLLALPGARPASAQGPVVVDIYPELRADGQVYLVGRWSNGTFTTATRFYPELRADGSVALVFFWDNGILSVLLNEYPEARQDGSVWLVRVWEGGEWSAIPVSGPALAAAGPSAPAPAGPGVLREYPEQRADGSIWFVRVYVDGSITAEPVSGAAVAAAGPGTPVAAPPPMGVRYPGVGYGMQVDPNTDLNRSIGMIRGAGFGWVKIQLRWDGLEGSRGAINWGPIDSWVNTANAQGVRLLFSVVTAPRWARPANTDFGVPGPPANPQDFANFLGSIAARHKGRVHAYEVWNEQNVNYEWGGPGNKLSASQYVELLRPAYAAIKAADPDAVVLSGAPTPTGVSDGNVAIDDVVFLRQMYEAGVKDVSDAIAAHPSGYNNLPDDWPGTVTCCGTQFKGHPSFYYRRFEQFREIMEEFGDGNKQIWFTEFGWASASGPIYSDYLYARDVSEQTQADALVRAYQIARERGYIGVMFIWNLNYAPIAEADDRWAKRAFSIIRTDWGPRPAYNALAAMPK